MMNLQQNNNNPNQQNIPAPMNPNRQQSIDVLFQKQGVKIQTIEFGGKEVVKPHPEASGQARSIIDQRNIAKLDKEQQRAFEVFVSSFVLTFYQNADQPIAGANASNQVFLKNHLRLCKLAGRIKPDEKTIPPQKN